MDTNQLEKYLHDRIPLARAMAIEVREATAGSPGEDQWARLRSALARGRPARVGVSAVLECLDARAGMFEGEFVLLPGPGDAT